MKKTNWKIGLAALAFIGLGGCADEGASTIQIGQQEEEFDQSADIEWGNNPNEMPEDGWKAALLPAMATDLDVPYAGGTRLKVSLISLQGDDLGEGIVGESVSWGVESGTELVSIAAKTSDTVENGIASMSVSTKKIAGEAYVLAYHPDAPKTVRFRLNILERPIGGINVRASYNGYANIQNYAIKLFNGSELICAYTDVKTGVDAEPIAVVESQSATFGDLPIDQNYAVVAYGYGANGAPVAVGCLDSGLRLAENQFVDGTVYLETINLDPAASYDVRSVFDLGDIAGSLGSFGTFINYVTDFVDNPGKLLYDELWKLINEWVGTLGTIAKTVVGWFNGDDALINFLNGKLTSNQTMCKIGMFGCQLRSAVRTMEFMGTLDVKKEGSIVLSGYNAYSGLAVYWRVKCTNSTDPNCGRYPVTTKKVGLSTLNFLEGAWAGSLSNGYDKLTIEPHELYLDYGKIIVYLVQKVLLPNLANGATTFEAALAYWIDCSSVGEWISKQLDRQIVRWVTTPPSPTKAEGWCKTACTGFAKVLHFTAVWAELKKTSSNLNISGTAFFVDSNGDNRVDDIDNGTWLGNMVVQVEGGEAKTTGVKGIWSGYNMDNAKIEGSIYCTNPKSSTDDEAQICAYPLVDTDKLVTSYLCKEYSKCANF